MRQIKFRGKRIDNGEWIYGYYVKDPESRFRMYWQPFIGATSNTYHFVKPETVGEFTGLHDKNGKQIYEGDILNTPTGTKEAMWNQLECAWGLFKNGSQSANMLADWINSDGSVPQIWEDKSLEIIGNIYEHPEPLNDLPF